MFFMGLGGSPDVPVGDMIDFGPVCTAAGKWLYKPASAKAALARGYPILCLEVGDVLMFAKL